MACILPPLHPLYIYLCNPLHPLDDFIGKRRGYDRPDAQPNPPHICQTPLHVYYSRSEFTPENLQKKRRAFLNRKSALRVMGDGRHGNGAKYFASLFHCWCYNPVVIFSLCLLAHAYHVGLSWQKNASLDVTVLFLTQVGKLVCSNSDSNKEVIRDQQLLGSHGGRNYGENLEIGSNSEK